MSNNQKEQAINSWLAEIGEQSYSEDVSTQVIVTCPCGNKYHMYWDQLFELHINWPIILKCTLCEREIDLFEEWKRIIADQKADKKTV